MLKGIVFENTGKMIKAYFYLALTLTPVPLYPCTPVSGTEMYTQICCETMHFGVGWLKYFL